MPVLHMINRRKIEKFKDVREFDCPTDSNCLQRETYDKEGRIVCYRLVPLNFLGKKGAYTEYYEYKEDGTRITERVWAIPRK